MSVRGGFHAGLWVLLIVLFCFSIRLGKPADGPERPAEDDGPRNVEFRLMCQPTSGPDPLLHRPRPPEHDDDPPALNARSHTEDAHVALQR